MSSLLTRQRAKIKRILQEEGSRELVRRLLRKGRERLLMPALWFWEAQSWKMLLQSRQPAQMQSGLRSTDIVICVHNALDDIRACLDSLARNPTTASRIILVDDGSDQATREFLEQTAQQQGMLLIRNDQARGYTLAANQGMRAASADQVVLLNSDTIVSPGWLDALREVAAADEQIGLVGPLSNTASWQSIPDVAEDGDWTVNQIPQDLSLDQYACALRHLVPNSHAQVGFLNGFCLLIKREVLDQLGLFDEATFARGYGEENDFCLRATKQGWRLAVALHSYVFHAQSRSYSDERRRELCIHADRQLTAKHGALIKQRQLERTMQHPLLQFSRSAARQAPDWHRCLTRLRDEFQGKRILFVLPAGHAGGGANVVLAEAYAMRLAGINAWIANLPQNRTSFLDSYPNLDVPCCWVEADQHDRLHEVCQGFDAVVATHNISAHWIHQLKEIRLGYYVQDYEPYFYPEGSIGRKHAEQSYQLNQDLRLFTKTAWTADRVSQEQNVACDVIGTSIHSQKFAPGSTAQQPSHVRRLRLLAMIRVSCQRRQPQLTARILHQLKRKYRHRLDIVCFGSSTAELMANGIRPGRSFTNLGRISSQEVAKQLQSSHLFLDASSFQAMGLTALEAMASGCVVIGPQHGGFQPLASTSNSQRAIAVNTLCEADIISEIDQLINDQTKLNQLSEQAMTVNELQPLYAAEAILHVLFRD
jgi:GT2 family glycosyltransferase